MRKFKKILAWLLLIIGLAIITGSLYFSYNIFTGRTEAPVLFEIGAKQEAALTSPSPENFQQEMEKIVEEQIKNMVPIEFTSQLLNLIAWSIFAGILIFGGSRLAFLGIRLMRKEI